MNSCRAEKNRLIFLQQLAETKATMNQKLTMYQSVYPYDKDMGIESLKRTLEEICPQKYVPQKRKTKI